MPFFSCVNNHIARTGTNNIGSTHTVEGHQPTVQNEHCLPECSASPVDAPLAAVFSESSGEQTTLLTDAERTVLSGMLSLDEMAAIDDWLLQLSSRELLAHHGVEGLIARYAFVISEYAGGAYVTSEEIHEGLEHLGILGLPTASEIENVCKNTVRFPSFIYGHERYFGMRSADLGEARNREIQRSLNEARPFILYLLIKDHYGVSDIVGFETLHCRSRPQPFGVWPDEASDGEPMLHRPPGYLGHPPERQK
jgi:hypothetical protein